MLFEQESLTPRGRILVLTRLFCELARRDSEPPPQGHVPVSVLEAHRDFEAHVRYMIEAAEKLCSDKERLRIFRKARHLLDSLPQLIMHTLSAGPENDWTRFYRTLVQLHHALEEAEPTMDEQEYTAIVQKMSALAGAVAQVSAIRIDGTSMFALMLTQALISKHSPRRRRPLRRKKRKK